MILTFLAFIGLVLTPAQAHAQTTPLPLTVVTPASTTITIMIRTASVKYDISYTEFYGTLKCESTLNPRRWNKADPNGGSKGIAQFQPATFNHYAKLAGVTDANVWDAKDSIEVAAYMFSIGQQRQWTCYRLLFA